jgi:hypothetical protein
MGFDMAPAQTPTFYNPLLDVPFFLAAQVLPGRLLSFLLGLIQGCNFVLLFFLARRALRLPQGPAGVWVAAGIALAGLLGGGHFGLIGTTFYDNILSLLILGAMLMVISAADLLLHGPMRLALARVFAAGALVGLAVGLKLPSQVFAVGVCFGLLFVPGPFTRRFRLSFVCGLGIVAGFIVTGGWWLWRMWQEFANPLFPYMNHVFRSPWALAEDYRDTRFLPETLAEVLTFPFRFALDSKIASEIAFTDWRIAVACAVLLITAALAAAGRTGAVASAQGFALRYLAAAAALAYAVWLAIFAIYRYIMPLEMLAPLLIVAAVAAWPFSGRIRAAIGAALLLLVTLTARTYEDWTRIPWGPGLGGPVVRVEVPPIEAPADMLILMTGLAPTSFVIPAFPGEIAFLRPVSYLAGPSHDTRFIAVMKARITAHGGALLALAPSWDRSTARESLAPLGLAV